MPDYNSINCPICDKRFTAGDDIVVCPVCGAPHHRSCWNENGKCQFDELHSEGFEWQRPQVEFNEPEEEQKTDSRAVVCKSCGMVNESGRFFCKKCGTLLNNPQNNKANDSQNAAGGASSNPFGANGAADPYALFTDPLGGVSPDEDFEGVKAKSLADFIGARSNYFMRIFKMFKQRKRIVFFNPVAFLFSGMWFISKKMYALGAAITAVMLGANCLDTYLEVTFTEPLYEKIKDLTYAEAYGYFATLSPIKLFVASILPFALRFVIYGGMFACGLFADILYKKHCQNKIKKASQMGANLNDINKKYGGTNMICAVSVAVCYFLINMGFQNFLY